MTGIGSALLVEGISQMRGKARDMDIHERAVAAQRRIRPYVLETPLERSHAFSELTGADVYLKLENLQRTGSFKARGAFNKLLSLDATSRARGVVAASTGNHGAAVAYALKVLDIPGIVFVPVNAAPAKVANIRRYGADIRTYGDEGGATELHARAFADRNGMVYASPYNDWDVVAGQATIGVEIERQLPDVNAVIAPLGGGGLIGGIAAHLKAQSPSIFVMASSPAHSKAMIASIAAGNIVETEHLPTISDGTAGGVEPGAITFEICRTYVDRFAEVDEAAIKSAMRLFVENEHMLLEGSAGVALAALLGNKDVFAGRRVVVVISGANIDAERLKEAL